MEKFMQFFSCDKKNLNFKLELNNVYKIKILYNMKV